jgi:CxxC motif-containing protein (DUF1111 family)
MQGLYRRAAKRFSTTSALLILVLGVPLVYAGVNDFSSLTNGFESQPDFDLDRQAFEAIEGIDDGLGPVFNMRSCAECHQNALTGTGSQVNELRVGRFDGSTFTDRPGGSLINDRAIAPEIQERASGADNVRTFRTSLNVLGDGFVEAIPDSEFTRIQNIQFPNRRGTIIRVPVLEAPGTTQIGRFGWKNQHASLLSFSADAYLNEMGITSPLLPNENSSNGASVAGFDNVPDPEDPAAPGHPFGEDVEAFARFMRSTRVPARDENHMNDPDVVAGEGLFKQIGCRECHVATLTTAPEGTQLNGGTFTVPAALASKDIHPYSDFMLHDVGTGDGIVQNGGPTTRNMIRTAPLWGLRTRTRFMHDGASLTPNDAIIRHNNQAAQVIQIYLTLTPTERQQILAFLDTL